MKRTKNINHSSFRKSWSARHLTPVALAVTAVFMLAGCEKSDETVSLYQNADDCSAANPGKAAECTTAYTNAVKEAERTAPKYATREDCVAEFGEGQCQQTPAQAGVGPGKPGAGAKQRQLLDAADGRLHDGRLMGGGMAQQQPLFSSKNPASPAYGQYTDASGKSYGAAQPGRTMNVPKTAMAPKPATTTTVTRGGFGESVAKQSTMQRSAAGSTSSSRSMGG
ncbi:ygiB [Klebsiella pneumoniae]|uniref:YgiB n=1 Tax=Klebsiella pneumoniae TaxID=573 RepID=A0A4P0YGI6_KLEPN|nr:ygiB [Klebsiella pneumoniae]